jgi:tripartite-type tricarboxylate transporter receptor subunit TctC
MSIRCIKCKKSSNSRWCFNSASATYPAKIVGPPMQYLLLLCALLSFGTLGAAADDYPSRPIRLIVPFAAGGAVDTVARVLTNPLNVSLAKPIVVYNRGGAGGILGMDEVAKSVPDGYTLLLAHSGLTSCGQNIGLRLLSLRSRI